MNELEKINETIFESIKHVDDDCNEYWYARELQKVLEYKRWDKFYNVIESAQVACSISNNNVLDHFFQVGKMINLSKGGQRKISDYKLSRYACYLIAKNGVTMPEDLPTPDKSLKELEKENNNLIIKNRK